MIELTEQGSGRRDKQRLLYKVSQKLLAGHFLYGFITRLAGADRIKMNRKGHLMFVP